jgi:hypothetical protein
MKIRELRNSLTGIEWITILISIYIISIPFKNLFLVEVMNERFQFGEFIFLLLTPIITFSFLLHKDYKLFQWTRMDLLIAIYFFVGLVTFGINAVKPCAYGGFAALMYSLSIYTFIRLYTTSLTRVKTLVKVLILSSFIAALTAIIGYVGIGHGLKHMNDFYPQYPFIGDTWRANGFFGNPALLSNYLGIGIFLILLFSPETIMKSTLKWLLIIMLVALLLTKMKTAVFVLAIIVLYIVYQFDFVSSFFKVSLKYLMLVLMTLVVFVSHFLPMNTDKARHLKSDYSTHHKPIEVTDQYSLVITQYYILREKALQLFKDHMPWGIGYRCFSEDCPTGYKFCNHLKPHSSHFGILSELGLFGFVTYIFLWIRSDYLIRTKFGSRVKQGLFFLFTFIFFESCLIDANSIQVSWILLGILGCEKDYSSLEVKTIS